MPDNLVDDNFQTIASVGWFVWLNFDGFLRRWFWCWIIYYKVHYSVYSFWRPRFSKPSSYFKFPNFPDFSCFLWNHFFIFSGRRYQTRLVYQRPLRVKSHLFISELFQIGRWSFSHFSISEERLFYFNLFWIGWSFSILLLYHQKKVQNLISL